MQETIDLIAHRELRNLRRYTRETGQPTTIGQLDLDPMTNVQSIEIDEEHITVQYNKQTKRRYNANEITHKEWVYKYNDDAEFVDAVRRVIELSRKHMYDLPQNLSCPPGCAECCSGYEPFVNRGDVQRIADHLGMTYDEAMAEYVVARESADGFVVGWLRKVDEEGARSEEAEHKCVFLMGSRSGRHYCGIYEARPSDCREFTPVGCEDVDWSLPRHGQYKTGKPFAPKRRRSAKS
ncbi:MAG: YkgJ family cysteine cluster protein [Candidatus Eremiobacteraeota bacterium]|nr:YkgJ family cysteine cluster protein [Candidatus Eremiobacteraeota bacterium]MBV8642931.1 YkgJ family cysteine cluster protein [Candidatus Eremiobacteraeota bacterium]